MAQPIMCGILNFFGDNAQLKLEMKQQRIYKNVTNEVKKMVYKENYH